MNVLSRLLPPIGHSTSPEWTGDSFVCENKIYPVLEYSQNDKGWSEDLTRFHEECAGEKHPIDRASRRNAIAQVQRYIPNAQASILEIGCSSGFLLHELRHTFPHALLLGADIVRAPLMQLARTLPHVPLMLFDITQCPLPSESIDIVIMLNVLEHIENDNLALKNAFKILKPGGHLIIEVPSGPFLFNSYDIMLKHFRRYSSKNLVSNLYNSGFQVLRKSHLGFTVFPMFCAIKLYQKYLVSEKNYSSETQRSITYTGKSHLLDYFLKFEEKYLSKISLPFGIRVLATAKKPIAHDAQT